MLPISASLGFILEVASWEHHAAPMVDTREIMGIAYEADVDVRSVRARLAGRRVRGRSGVRLERVLVARGIVTPTPANACRGGPPAEQETRLAP
jgi:hypothetical protein